MQIHYDLDHFYAVKPVVTIGTFDGVHLGHCEVISELKQISKVSGGESVVFTFDPHPRVVVLPNEDTIRLLSTIEEKILSFKKMEIDHLVIYPFTEEFSKLSYKDFMTNILVDKMGLSCLVVGHDHRFGQGRMGDFSAIKILSKLLNFKVEQLSHFLVNGNLVSSSKIRTALESGDISGANHYLGYEYRLSGKVVEGRKLGRRIGFPTANIETFDRHKLVPGDGVYAVKVNIGNEVYCGMCNIGFRPTVNFNVDHKSIEVHIFDFDRDIYGSVISLNFIEKIRNEHKFSNIYELQEQLNKDKFSALKITLNQNK